jgi:hypothetical protein
MGHVCHEIKIAYRPGEVGSLHRSETGNQFTHAIGDDEIERTQGNCVWQALEELPQEYSQADFQDPIIGIVSCATWRSEVDQLGRVSNEKA